MKAKNVTLTDAELDYCNAEGVSPTAFAKAKAKKSSLPVVNAKLEREALRPKGTALEIKQNRESGKDNLLDEIRLEEELIGQYEEVEVTLNEPVCPARLIGFGYNENGELCLLRGVYRGAKLCGILEDKITVKEAVKIKRLIQAVRDKFGASSSTCFDAADRFNATMMAAIP